MKDPPRRETNRLQILVFDHYHQMNTPDIQYVLLTNPNGMEQVCFNRNISHSEAVWVENSIESTLPAFVLQFAIILVVNRLFLVLSELFHVPRIVANIFVSILYPSKKLRTQLRLHQHLFAIFCNINYQISNRNYVHNCNLTLILD